MNLLNVFRVIELVVAILLIVFVLLQNRGSSMGVVFGGGGGSTFRSRRGTEALLFNGTIVLGIVFAVLALAIAILDVRAA